MRKKNIYKGGWICLECFKKFPEGSNASALLWLYDLLDRRDFRFIDKKSVYHHIGRVRINGDHTFFDELLIMPLYDRLPPACFPLALMNPPNVQEGVRFVTMAAEDGRIPAMLDLADTYSTDFKNDSFARDKKKAEYWFRRALGQGNRIHPLAFTRYGQFLDSESRHAEAKNMFQIAAMHGHARGQYEYALHLLRHYDESATIATDAVTSPSSNEEKNLAIEWLCKASQKGYYVPSYLCLAQTLIEIADQAYASVHMVGRSPLPRVIQILLLLKEEHRHTYGSTQWLQGEADKLLLRYKCDDICENCGAKNVPLQCCSGCHALFYCSRICQRKSYRDGHKFDCCSREQLFDIHLIKCSLPWMRTAGWKGIGLQPALVRGKNLTLIEMVEDDTDEIYGEDEPDYDEEMLAQHMLRMRKNLEVYLGRILQKDISQASLPEGPATATIPEPRRSSTATENRNEKLVKRINMFEKKVKKSADGTTNYEAFIQAMHKIRIYGNDAAHFSPDNSVRLRNTECEAVVRAYREEKEKFERLNAGFGDSAGHNRPSPEITASTIRKTASQTPAKAPNNDSVGGQVAPCDTKEKHRNAVSISTEVSFGNTITCEGDNHATASVARSVLETVGESPASRTEGAPSNNGQRRQQKKKKAKKKRHQ
jgi:TPR repeat protein